MLILPLVFPIGFAVAATPPVAWEEFVAAAATGIKSHPLIADESTLLTLLRDSDLGVRYRALRGLRRYAGDSGRVVSAVAAVAADSGEDAGIRFEAMKTLSYAEGSSAAEGALLDLAQDGSISPPLRAAAWKSSYAFVATHPSVRAAMLDAARTERDETIRRGALWGIFAGATDAEVRAALLTAAKDTWLSAGVRREALRSLYAAAGESEIREFSRATAQDHWSPAEIRRVAIMLLATSSESADADVLRELAARDSDAEVRRIAVVALDPAPGDLETFFHLPVRDGRGVLVRDPLDAE